MKKNTLVLALSLALTGLVSTAASAATVAGGSINFEGEVTDQTCLINGQAPNGAVDLNVKLEPVSVSELSHAGATAKPKDFTITLGGDNDLNCANGKVASVSFDSSSPAINGMTGWLSNTVAEDVAAENVQIQILNKETSNVINLLSGNNNYTPKTIANNTAVFEYVGQYVAVGGAASAGKVASSVKYNIVYQ
ncbi:TPA: fimbrial protein [Serratia fonticola]